MCLSTEPLSPPPPPSGWKNIFHFINHVLSKQCCSRHALRSAGSAQSSWYWLHRDLSLLGCYPERVGLGVVVGVCITQGTCVTRVLGRAGITPFCFTKGPTKLCLRGYGQGGRSLLCCLILKLLQLYMHIPCLLNVASQWPVFLPGWPLDLGYIYNLEAVPPFPPWAHTPLGWVHFSSLGREKNNVHSTCRHCVLGYKLRERPGSLQRPLWGL